MATKICPYCKEEINAAATKCPYCQSELPREVYEKGLLSDVFCGIVAIGLSISCTSKLMDLFSMDSILIAFFLFTILFLVFGLLIMMVLDEIQIRLKKLFKK